MSKTSVCFDTETTCEDHTNKSQKDNGYQVVFLAKTKKGYHNLVKMSSKAYTSIHRGEHKRSKIICLTKKI
jgi:DNA polymerase III alpha subunit